MQLFKISDALLNHLFEFLVFGAPFKLGNVSQLIE